MLSPNISLGDLAVYNGCSPAFLSSIIIYEHSTPPYEHIYCLNQFSYLNTIAVKLYNHLNIILITKNMHIAVIIFHYELHVPYDLQFKYLYPFYVEFKS